jgi:WD40 repeat protein
MPVTALLLLALAAGRDDEFRELKGHEGPPRCCLYTPDGKTLVSASGWPEGDKTVRVWDVATGKATFTLKGHTGFIDYLCLTPDGKLAVSGSHDKTARVWDLVAGKEKVVFKEHTKTVTATAVSPDGKTVATGDGDGRIVLWAIADGKVVRDLAKVHDGEVRCLTFSPDGTSLYSGSWDKLVKVWDPATGKERRTIEPDGKRVENFVLYDGGKKLLIACDQIVLWDTVKNEPIRRYGEGGAISCAVAPDGKTLLTGWYDGKLRQWNLATGAMQAEYQAHEAFCHGIAFAPDGKTFATAGGGDYNGGKPTKGKDHVVRIWKFEPGE